MNILVDSNILVSEAVFLDLESLIVTIESCENIQIVLNVVAQNINLIHKIVKVCKQTVISAHHTISIDIQEIKLSDDRDLFFEPDCKLVRTYVTVMNCHITAVQLMNDTANDVVILRNTNLGSIIEYEADGCFHMNFASMPVTL